MILANFIRRFFYPRRRRSLLPFLPVSAKKPQGWWSVVEDRPGIRTKSRKKKRKRMSRMENGRRHRSGRVNEEGCKAAGKEGEENRMDIDTHLPRY